MNYKILFLLIFMAVFLQAKAQQAEQVTVHDASNPALVRNRVVLDLDTYFFENGSTFYAIKPAYNYGVRNERHQFALAIPFFHNVFSGDYGGYENTSGIGDTKMTYMVVPVINRNVLGFERLSTYMEVSAPTGEEQLGRGSGVWMYKPGVVGTFHATPGVSFYPEVRYQFSSNSANSQSGSDGLPDADDPEEDGKVQTLTVELPAVIVVENWNGWFALHAQYAHSFTEEVGFFYMRMDLGKMIGNKTSAALNIQKFIAGQPRLNLIIQARLQFFLR